MVVALWAARATEEGRAGILLTEQQPELQQSWGSRALLAPAPPMQYFFNQHTE